MSGFNWFENVTAVRMDDPVHVLISAVQNRDPAIVIHDNSGKYFAYQAENLRIKPWFVKMQRKRTGTIAQYMTGLDEPLATVIFKDLDLSGISMCGVEVNQSGDPLRVCFPAKLPIRRPGAVKSAPAPMAAPPAPAPVAATESITRYATVDTSVELAPGVEVDFTVDLPSTPPSGVKDPDTVTISGLPGDWQEAEVAVELMSAHIEFGAASGPIVLRRDGTSTAAKIHGTVSADCAAGQSILVVAMFQFRERPVGFIRRLFQLGQAGAGNPDRPLGLDFVPVPPVITVQIFQIDAKYTGKLFWSLVLPPGVEIPGMPQRLHDTIDLGDEAADFIGTLYKALPQIENGEHMNLFHGVGETLWKKSPSFFQKAYWALRKTLGDKFPIQFISTDPFIPWELMRPISDDDSVTTELLAMTHPVARCLGDSQGSLRHTLPAGKIVTIAPLYERVNDRLDRAQNETKLLQTKYAAVPVTGTYEGVWELLTHGLDPGPVSIVHFCGHGDFPIGGAALASLKLQNRNLTVLDVGTQEVKLGKKNGCLVVLNACEAGATGSLLGGVGGWASTLLEQRFGGCIAPLWAVDDSDAATVAADLFDALVTRKLEVSQALLSIRQQYGKRSPTYLAYLYYGDVSARVG